MSDGPTPAVLSLDRPPRAGSNGQRWPFGCFRRGRCSHSADRSEPRRQIHQQFSLMVTLRRSNQGFTAGRAGHGTRSSCARAPADGNHPPPPEGSDPLHPKSRPGHSRTSAILTLSFVGLSLEKRTRPVPVIWQTCSQSWTSLLMLVSGLAWIKPTYCIIIAATVEFTPTYRGERKAKGVGEMPQVVLCQYCKERVEKDQQAYVVIFKGSATAPESIAHEECYKKRRQSSGGQIAPAW
jgi:hypothetical protein